MDSSAFPDDALMEFAVDHTTECTPSDSSLTENISVCIRVRPLTEREERAKDANILRIIPNLHAITVLHAVTEQPLPGKHNTFQYDHIFGPDQRTLDIYDHVAHDIVQSAMNGINGTIFAYGQTSSGKTYTMQGDTLLLENTPFSCDKGIIPLAVNDIFNFIESCSDRVFLLRVAYFEIYNEVIRDLLSLTEEKQILKIREDPRKRGVYVDSQEEIITNAQSIFQLLTQGNQRRTIGHTAMNEKSSRSHAIFRIIIESKQKLISGGFEGVELRDRRTSEDDVNGAVLVASLSFVDLAGSESLRHTMAEGIRQREAGNINKSLLTLSRVINALASQKSGSGTLNIPPNPQQPSAPFRDSKLTRLLQNSLDGNTRTLIICCVTPSDRFLEETKSTLQFAARAKKIQTSAVVNEILDDQAQLRRLKKEVRELKRMAHENATVTALKAENEALVKKQTEIQRLMSLMLSSSSVSGSEDRARRPECKRIKRGRETWCPGELKQSMENLESEWRIESQIESRLSLERKRSRGDEDAPTETNLMDKFDVWKCFHEQVTAQVGIELECDEKCSWNDRFAEAIRVISAHCLEKLTEEKTQDNSATEALIQALKMEKEELSKSLETFHETANALTIEKEAMTSVKEQLRETEKALLESKTLFSEKEEEFGKALERGKCEKQQAIRELTDQLQSAFIEVEEANLLRKEQAAQYQKQLDTMKREHEANWSELDAIKKDDDKAERMERIATQQTVEESRLRCESLSMQREEWQSTAMRLKEEYHRNIYALQTRCEVAEKHTKALNEAIVDGNDQRHRMEKQFHAERNELMQQLSRVEKEFKAKLVQNEKSDTQMTELYDRIDMLERLNASLKEEQSSNATRSLAFEQMGKELQSLQESNETLKLDVQSYSEMLQKKQTEANVLMESVRLLESAAEESQHRQQVSLSQCKELEKAVDRAIQDRNSALEELQFHQKKMREELDERMRIAESEKSSREKVAMERQKLVEAYAHIEKEKKELATELSLQIQTSERELHAKEQEISAGRQALHEAKAWKTRNEKLECDLYQQRNALEDVSESLKCAEQQVLESREQLQRESNAKEQLEALVKTQKERIDTLERVKMTTGTIEIYQKLVRDRYTLQERVETLTKQQNTESTEMERYKEEILRLRDLIQQQESGTKDMELSEAQREKERLEERVLRLETDHQVALAESREKIAYLEKENLDLMVENRQMKKVRGTITEISRSDAPTEARETRNVNEWTLVNDLVAKEEDEKPACTQQ
uniref:Kinesinlike protein putative n=1 Tax=Albugo laibachii Nc14 TaxID=890382 RepID=F0W6A7_9STRA|nr:kinesinlike protein putative [Albugo laibachii Nc14]|eukprot:CCA16650.1 kinesinlike protein putative [Albugo laibachii Nc14]